MFIGYIGYLISILYLTGSLILLADVKAYKNAKLHKERKASQYLGWINISFGFVLLLANLAYKYLLW